MNNAKRPLQYYKVPLTHYLSDDEFFDFAVLASSGSERKVSTIEFLPDSGASDHMVQCSDWLRDVRQIELKGIVLGNGNKVYATHRRTLVLGTRIGTGNDIYERDIVLKQVLFVLDLRENLISCSMLCNDDYSINFNPRKCVGL